MGSLKARELPCSHKIRKGMPFTTCGSTYKCVEYRGTAALQRRLIPRISRASAPVLAFVSTTHSAAACVSLPYVGVFLCRRKRAADDLARGSRRSLRLLQQATRLRDQFGYFEGFHQVGYVVLLQKSPLIALLHTIGERKQHVRLHGRAVFL